MRKKRMAQSGDTGILTTASGYTINARPGPYDKKHNVKL